MDDLRAVLDFDEEPDRTCIDRVLTVRNPIGAVAESWSQGGPGRARSGPPASRGQKVLLRQLMDGGIPCLRWLFGTTDAIWTSKPNARRQEFGAKVDKAVILLLATVCSGCHSPGAPLPVLTDQPAADTIHVGDLSRISRSKLVAVAPEWDLTIVQLTAFFHDALEESLVLAGPRNDGIPVVNVVDLRAHGLPPREILLPGELPPVWVQSVSGGEIAYYTEGDKHLVVVDSSGGVRMEVGLHDFEGPSRYGQVVTPLWADPGPTLTFIGTPYQLAGEGGVRWTEAPLIRTKFDPTRADTISSVDRAQILWSPSGHLSLVFGAFGHFHRNGDLAVVSRGDRPSVSTFSVSPSGRMDALEEYSWSGVIHGDERPDSENLEAWLTWRRSLQTAVGTLLPDFVRLADTYPIHSDLFLSGAGEIWVLLGPWPRLAPIEVLPGDRTWLRIGSDGSARLVEAEATSIVVGSQVDRVVTVKHSDERSTLRAGFAVPRHSIARLRE